MITSTDILAARADADTLLAYCFQLLGALDEARGKKVVTRHVTTGNATWITPFQAAWDAELGAGSFPLTAALKPFQKLRTAGNVDAEICLRLRHYLKDAQRRNAMQFASPAAFAKAYAANDPHAPAFPEDDQ